MNRKLILLYKNCITVSNMPDSEYKDAITYTQPLIKEITDETTIQLFKDENLWLVLRLLRECNCPMTVKELEESFRRTGKKKSDKTIYRYLKKLEASGLVIPAGKRVYPCEKKITTQTLYMRTAKIFLTIGKSMKKEACEDEQRQKDITLNIIGALLAKQINGDLKSIKILEKEIDKIFERRYEIYRNLLRDADKEITESVIKLDWKYVEMMLERTSLLALFIDSTDWGTQLKNCFNLSSGSE